MMNAISLRCTGCKARIKAPAQLIGQTRPCPACGYRLHVQRPRVCEDAGPMLAHDDRPAARRPRLLN
jgi:hypothetical protein